MNATYRLYTRLRGRLFSVPLLLFVNFAGMQWLYVGRCSKTRAFRIPIATLIGLSCSADFSWLFFCSTSLFAQSSAVNTGNVKEVPFLYTIQIALHQCLNSLARRGWGCPPIGERHA